MRVFETGASRDTEEGKIDFDCLSPIALEYFSQYMHGKRKMPDGTMRNADNWQFGIPKNSYMKSLLRHVFLFWKWHRGSTIKENAKDELCAIIFNAQGYLHTMLVEEVAFPTTNFSEAMKLVMTEMGEADEQQFTVRGRF